MTERNDPITTLIHADSDGNNNWYKNNVEITFNVEDESDFNLIFFKWDNESTFRQYPISDSANPETLTIAAQGGETQGTLFYSPIVSEGFQIKRNGLLLTRNTDYQVNLTNGNVEFLTAINTNDQVTATYDYYVTVENETLINNAIGGELVFYLANTHLVDGTVEIRVDNVLVTNYTVDLSSGKIVFNTGLPANSSVTSNYSHIVLNNLSSVSGEVLIGSATGGEQSFYLSNTPIVTSSEQIFLNNIALNQGTDYSISYVTGQVTLTFELQAEDELIANYYTDASETLVTSATTGQITVIIPNIPIVDNTFTIQVNGTDKRRFEEYTLTNTTGTITLNSETFPTGLASGDRVNAYYFYAISDEITVNSAGAGQVSFFTNEAPVFNGSLRLRLNGANLIENTDYTVNYTTGQVTLVSAMSAGDQIVSDYYAESENYETVILSASGSETTFLLDHKNVVADTLVLQYVPNVGPIRNLQSVPEFVLDIDTGEIVFTTALSSGDTVTAEYQYENEDEILASSATGGETQFSLANTVITTSSLTLNGSTTLVENVDYEIDKINGSIILDNPLKNGDSLAASYTYSKSILNEYVIRKARTANRGLIGGSSLSVSQNSTQLDYNTDYTVDHINGFITFSSLLQQGDTIESTYKYVTTQTAVTETKSGAGQDTFQTNFSPVVQNSVTVVINPSATTLVEFIDYTINYSTGEIFLATPLSVGETIDVDYQYGGPLTIPSLGIHPIQFYSEDIEGNKEEIKTAEFKFDNQGPISSADVPDGLQTEPVTINFFSSDDVSGVERIFYTTDGSTPTIDSKSATNVVISANGNTTIKYFAIDFAGNMESIKEASIVAEIDTVAPTIHIQESFPINGNNGYYRTSPTISLEATGEANLDKIYYKLVSSDDISTAKYTSLVGLSSPVDLSSVFFVRLEIDQSGTEIQVDCRGLDPANTTITEIIDAINTATTTITPVVNEDSITDGTFTLETKNDNIVSVSTLRNVSTGENYTYVSNTSNTITFSGINAPDASDVMRVDYEFSTNTIAVETDSAGNAGTGYITIVSPTARTGSATSEIKFLQPATSDATNEIFGLDEGSYPHTFTEVNVFVEYTTPFTLPANGKYNLQAYGIDTAGNIGGTSEQNYQLDNQGPSTSVITTGGTIGNLGYYTSNPTIRFSASDNISGIAHILYKWNSTTPPFTEYVDTRPIDDSTEIPSEGSHVLNYYSIDRAGNQEALQQAIFNLDGLAPTTTDNSSLIVASPVNINRLQISKTGPNSTLNINNNILEFTGPDPLGPFDLNFFSLQDITDAINAGAVSGYSATLVTDFSTPSEAGTMPAILLFDIDNLTITPTPVLIYSSIAITITTTDTFSGIDQTYFTITDDGSTPSIPTDSSTPGLYNVAGQVLKMRVAGTWVFNSVSIGGETIAKIPNQPILADSLLVFKNGILLTEGIDYTVDLYIGEITLTSPLLVGDELTADYRYGTIIGIGNDGIYKIKYFSRDLAGNDESVSDLKNTSSLIEINRNLPTISFTASVSPESSGWFITNPTITITATAELPETIVDLYYRWDSDPFTQVSGSITNTTIPNDGQSTLEAYAIDTANRVGQIFSLDFYKDEVSPVTTENSLISALDTLFNPAQGGETEVALSNPHVKTGTLIVYRNAIPLTSGVDYTVNYTTGNLFFNPTVLLAGDTVTADYQYTLTSNADVDVTFSVTDASPGSGINKTYYEIGTVSSPPSNPTIASPFNTGSPNIVSLTTSGEYIIKYFSQDIAGNNEAIQQTEIIRVDKDKPITTMVRTPSLPNGDNNFYVTPVVISFNVTPGSSGLRTTYYRLTDTSSYVAYTGPFSIPDGIYNIEFYSIDLAGNLEEPNVELVQQDTVYPTTTDVIPTVPISSGVVTLSHSDAVSGVRDTYYQVLDSFGNPINTRTAINEIVVSTKQTYKHILNYPFLVSGSEVIRKNSIVLVNGVDYTIDYDWGIITYASQINIGDVLDNDYTYTLDLNNSSSGATFTVTAEGNFIIRYFSVDNAGNYEMVNTALNLLNLDLTKPEILNLNPPDMIVDDTTEQLSFRVQDTGVNPSGIDPFSVRVYVDNIEYSLLRSSEYFLATAVGLNISDVINDTTVSVTNEFIIPSAAGGETTFTVANPPVAYNTQRLYLNGEFLIEGVHYSFNNNLGEYTLNTPLELNDSISTDYRYLTVFHDTYDFAIVASISQSESLSGGLLNYTLSNTPIANAGYIITDNGVLQIEGTDYTLDKTTGALVFGAPTVGPVVANYKQISGTLKDEIENFDVIRNITIDPSDVAGNQTDPLTFDFIANDLTPPFVTGLNPRPNSRDVSTSSAVMFEIYDEQTGVDIDSIVVGINNQQYFIKTSEVLRIQYIGTASIAIATIINNNFITRINGQLDQNFSFLDTNYDTIQKVQEYLNSLPDYSATIIDFTFSQEPSESLLSFRNQDIKSVYAMKAKFLFDTSFAYVEKSNGYLVTITPTTIFENLQNVLVTIDAKDSSGNSMAPIKYSFQTQLGASKSVGDRLALMNKAEDVIQDIFEDLASNYNTKTRATEFYQHIRIFSEEIARIFCLLDDIRNDYYFDSIREQLLYQNLGVLVDFSPRDINSTSIYHDFLRTILKAYLSGSLKSSVEAAINLFTDTNITVRERYVDFPEDLTQQFIFDVLVEVTSTSRVKSLIELLNRDLNQIIRQIKPAHTFFLLGFLFSETFGLATGCNNIPLTDIFGNPIYDYYGNQLSEWDSSAWAVYIDGEIQTEVKNYTINVQLGTLEFVTPLSSGDQVIADYKEKYVVDDENITIIAGNNTFNLGGSPIVPLSLRITRNENPLLERIDYTVDYVNGIITLADPMIALDVISVDYAWFVQVVGNVILNSAVGGETTLNLPYAPLVDIRFPKREKISEFSICDRHFMSLEITKPFIDFHLNGKPHFFSTQDPQSLLNDQAVLVSTRWQAFDYIQSYTFDYTNSPDFFPAPTEDRFFFIEMFREDAHDTPNETTDTKTWAYDMFRQEAIPSINETDRSMWINMEQNDSYSGFVDDDEWFMFTFLTDTRPMQITSEDLRNYLTSFHSDIFGTFIDEITIDQLIEFDEAFPLVQETHERNYMFTFLSEFTPNPVETRFFLAIMFFSDAWSNPSDIETKHIEIRLSETFPATTDEISVDNTVFNTEVSPAPLDSNLRYNFFFTDDVEDAFYMPDIDNQGSYSYVSSSRLNTNKELWKKAYTDELTSINLV